MCEGCSSQPWSLGARTAAGLEWRCYKKSLASCHQRQTSSDMVDAYNSTWQCLTLSNHPVNPMIELHIQHPWHTVDGQNIQTLRKRLDWHPRPQMSKVYKERVRDMSCCGGWFLLSTRLNPWKKKTTLIFFGGGRGIKLSRVWIICASTIVRQVPSKMRWPFGQIQSQQLFWKKHVISWY